MFNYTYVYSNINSLITIWNRVCEALSHFGKLCNNYGSKNRILLKDKRISGTDQEVITRHGIKVRLPRAAL